MKLEEKSLKSLEFDKTAEKLSSFAKLQQSKDKCLRINIHSGIEKIKREIELTKEAKSILDIPLELPLEYAADINGIKNSTISSYLKEEEILSVAKTIRTSRLVRNFLKENLPQDAILYSMSNLLFSDKRLEDRIFATIDDNLKIVRDATPELKSLYNSFKDSQSNLKTRTNELLNSPEFSKHLQEQIYTMRDERVVFQVRAASKSKVDGIIHDVSASSQSFYIEPSQLVPLNNKIREIKAKIQAEIINILTDLTKSIRIHIEEIQISEDLLAQIDFHFAKARYAIKLKAVEPEIVGERFLKFDAMRHPLLSDYVEHVVENDFEVGKNYKSVIITGSNTGGKTVVLKTAGLFILMAKAGLFLPCSEAKVYPFEKIFADIGDEQNIAQSLSTFSSHMTNIIEMLERSDKETFIAIDEICAGTDPQEGSILAQTVLEQLALKGAVSCITTHFGELKALEYSNPYFKNACVDFDLKTLKPTYKLSIGIPGASNAILIAANLGLEKKLADKAKNILAAQKDSSIIVVEKLQELQNELGEKLQNVQRLEEENLKLKKDYESKLSKIKKDRKKTIKAVKDKLENELEAAKEEIKDILSELRREKSEKVARRSYSRLAMQEKALRKEINNHEEDEIYAELNWEKIKTGDNVLLKELNQPVVLLSVPDKNGNVFVQMGLIKTQINKDKLAIFTEKTIKKIPLKFQPEKSFELKKRDMSNTLDLRGYRVEEALDSLELFLDKASLANLSPVYVIHGHGTGALKSAVREFLKTSPYAADCRVGEPSEGGDGVSIVDIK